MPTLVPIVEGYGEVQAVPELVRRVLQHHQAYEISVDHPIRQSRSKLAREDTFKAAVAVARKQTDCSAILVVFDADKDCPADLAPQLLRWGADQLGEFPLWVVIAKREYEAWLIASIESLQGRRNIRSDARPPDDVEVIHDAKGWLSAQMPALIKYSETCDQAALTAALDFRLAHQRSSSFRKLWRDLARLTERLHGGFIDLPELE
jgi:hypothetical protein